MGRKDKTRMSLLLGFLLCCAVGITTACKINKSTEEECEPERVVIRIELPGETYQGVIEQPRYQINTD